MLFLLIISQVLSNTQTINIQLNDEKYYSISKEYDSVDITIPGNQALMFVGWDDAVVTFDWNDRDVPTTATFTKEVGLSFFIFKNDANIHITFKTGLSFYTTCMQNIRNDWNILYSNMKSYCNEIDTTNKNTGYHIYSPIPFGLSNSPFDGEYCGFKYHYNSQTTGKFGSFNIGPFNSPLGVNDFDCEKATELCIYSEEQFTTTVPTIINYPLNEIIQNSNVKSNICFGGMHDSVKMQDMSYLTLYNYIFILNNIKKKPEEYNLTVSMVMANGNIITEEIKPGKVFSYAFNGYFSVTLSIKSKKGSQNNFKSIGGEKLELDENNQPKMYSFDDSMIPDHVVVKGSNGLKPGVIAAIVIVVIVVVAAIIVGVIFFLRKRKNNDNNSTQEGNSGSNFRLIQNQV